MRRRFDSEYIKSELREIGRQLDTDLTVYLIGGGAMSFRDLKETTKDIDLIVTDGDDLRILQAVLLERGYDIVRDPSEEYDELGAQRILENDDGCRIDIFIDLLPRLKTRESRHGISSRAKRPVGFKTHTFHTLSAGFQHRCGCLVARSKRPHP